MQQGVSISTMVGINIIFWLIYRVESPFFEQYKIRPEDKWPWQADPKAWSELIRKTIMLVLFNTLVVSPCTVYVFAALEDFKMKHTMSVEDLPDKFTLIWQLYFCIIAEDIAFSYAHRLLHKPFFYKHIHKVHHTYVQQVAICATYAHPVEYSLGNVIPVGMGFLILGKRCHYYTYLVYLFFRVLDTTLGHCGYAFPWLSCFDFVPFRGTGSIHEYHHSGGAFYGNYSGMTTICDTMWGTNKRYWNEFKVKMGCAKRSKKSVG